jgi:hypothetical protein
MTDLSAAMTDLSAAMTDLGAAMIDFLLRSLLLYESNDMI